VSGGRWRGLWGSAGTLMPRGWNGDLVRRRMTMPSVVAPVRWSSFFTTVTRAPTVTADRTVPCELVLLEPAAVFGAGERKDLLRPEVLLGRGWPGRCQAKAPIGCFLVFTDTVLFMRRPMPSASPEFPRIESDGEADNAVRVLFSLHERTSISFALVSDIEGNIGEANSRRR
jgi:hypothetical protein